MRRTADVLVIGGGVIGCAIADAAAASGRSVLLVDRGALGAEASSAAAGVLAVGSSEAEGPQLALRRASLERFRALAERLGSETGVDIELEVSGVLELSLSEEDEAPAKARGTRRRAGGFQVECLDAAALRREAPHANPRARGALFFADDARVNNERLVEAFARAARGRGAELVPGAEVLATERVGERIARVRVGADWVTAETVVLAAGAWAARVPGIAPDLGIEPARGQMLAVRPGRAVSPHMLSDRDGYLVPRRSGELLLGATVEDAGFSKAVTPAGIGALLGRLERLAPGLDASLTRMWAGLRPYAPAGGPILGRAPGIANLLLACGHHRNGILLAPITAAVLAALLLDQPPPIDLTPFLPARRAAA